MTGLRYLALLLALGVLGLAVAPVGGQVARRAYLPFVAREATPTPPPTPTPAPIAIRLRYRAYMQDQGWGGLGYGRGGGVAGSAGALRPLEGFRAYARTGPAEPARIHVAYTVNVESVGWLEWKRDGDIAGSTGQALRLEAFGVRLFNRP